MKKLNIKFACFVLLLFVSNALLAQQDDKKEKKQIVIITKTVDEEGNIVTEKIVKEGADADAYIIESDGEQIIKMKKEVSVDVDDTGEEKQIKIRISKDDADEVELIEWKGEEMSEEMLKELEMKGIFIHDGKGHKVVKVDPSTAPNRACLGVMIGQKETVENINGEETIVVEGASEEGVPVLEIMENSAAQDAGIQKGDLITAINGSEVASIEDVLDLLEPFEAGATVTVDYLRDEVPTQSTATLKKCAASPPTEIIEEIEWESADGDVIELKGNNWIFIEEDTDSESPGKVIIKKMKDGEEVIIEEEIEIEEGTFAPAHNLERSLDIETIDIFPNPTDGKLNLKFSAPKAPTVVTVLDINGKEIYNDNINNFDGRFEKEIDLENAAKGALILSIRQGDKVFSEKILLQ